MLRKAARMAAGVIGFTWRMGGGHQTVLEGDDISSAVSKQAGLHPWPLCTDDQYTLTLYISLARPSRKWLVTGTP